MELTNAPQTVQNGSVSSWMTPAQRPHMGPWLQALSKMLLQTTSAKKRSSSDSTCFRHRTQLGPSWAGRTAGS
eukprot:10050986-Alexandrium_andersonii.AAC.1